MEFVQGVNEDDNDQFADDPQDDGVSPGALFLSTKPAGTGAVALQTKVAAHDETSDAAPAPAATSVQTKMPSQLQDEVTVSEGNETRIRPDAPASQPKTTEAIHVTAEIHQTGASSHSGPSLVTNKDSKHPLVAPSRKQRLVNSISGREETTLEAATKNTRQVVIDLSAPIVAAERPPTLPSDMHAVSKASAQPLVEPPALHPWAQFDVPEYLRLHNHPTQPRTMPDDSRQEHAKSASIGVLPEAGAASTQIPESRSGASVSAADQPPRKGAKKPARRKKVAKRKPASSEKNSTADKTDTNLPTVDVIAISSIETQVCKAARLVAQELEHGGWPEASRGARQEAAVAIEEFARTIFLPYVQQNPQDTKGTSSGPANERVFLATLLALREILTQNAQRIFALEAVPTQTGEEEKVDTESAPGSKRRKLQREDEEQQYMAQLYATGVIVATIQGMPEADLYVPKFTEIMDSYDDGEEAFASCLNPANGQHQGVLANGKLLKAEENVAWKVSYNRARDLHPLLERRRQRLMEQQRPTNESSRIRVPSPNAILVSMIERKSSE